jgi:zinc D-Ala-D-Ala carboxypeptidase
MAKYFTDSEVVGLVPELVEKLDKTRELCGFPFAITSGFRTQEENDRIGGTKNSAHLKGMAADIKRPLDNDLLYRMCWAAGLAGFRRIEIATRHVHLDTDPDKTQDIMWFGVSR